MCFNDSRALPSTSIQLNDIVIDRSGQSVDMEGDSSSESELGAEETGRETMDTGMQKALVDSSSESDLGDNTLKEAADGSKRTQDTIRNVVDLSESDIDIDKNETTEAAEVELEEARLKPVLQIKGLARDRLRQKKLKRKVLISS